MNDDDIQVPPLTNREKKKKPHSNTFWCWGCDMCIISAGEKCPVCGVKDLSKQSRKRDIKLYDKE